MWNISVSLTIASMCVVTVMCIPVMPDTRINGTEAENILYENCLETQYQCWDSDCIPNDKVCDCTWDCSDGDDESLCNDIDCGYTCEADEFQCANGGCIDLEWRCDNFTDCHDMSDERNCSIDYNVQSSQTAHERKLTGSLNAKENSQFTKGANVMTEEELNDGIEETSS